jgi:catechol 2,3-dioxygenase-like lactoylglutathione lyase family enzyme
VLDSPDPKALARFYSELLGWPVWKPEEAEEDEAALDLEEGVAYLSFHLKEDYVRPVWPNRPGEQQMQVHLDFEASDLDEATAHAVRLGAELAPQQALDEVRVLFDPDGHPFCFYAEATYTAAGTNGTGRRRGRPGDDRMQRDDWWGVVLDSGDPVAAARFYSDLLGWPVHEGPMSPGHTALDAGEGVAYLSFHLKDDHVRPVWPNTPGEEQMMMHLDFEVADLPEAMAYALEHGAVLADHQPQDDVRVFYDPDGHPFCLYAHG